MAGLVKQRSVCYLQSLDPGPGEVAAAGVRPGGRLDKGGGAPEAVDGVWSLSLRELPLAYPLNPLDTSWSSTCKDYPLKGLAPVRSRSDKSVRFL